MAHRLNSSRKWPKRIFLVKIAILARKKGTINPITIRNKILSLKKKAETRKKTEFESRCRLVK